MKIMKLQTYFIFNPDLKIADWVDKPVRKGDKIIGTIINVKFNRKTNNHDVEIKINPIYQQMLIDDMKINKYSFGNEQ